MKLEGSIIIFITNWKTNIAQWKEGENIDIDDDWS